MKTVLEIITSTTDYFTKNQVESPRLNIEHILAHVLRKKRMELYMEFDRPLGDLELNPLRDLVRRRAQGEPLQHILGTVEFFHHSLLCDKRALIPRPETEQLCELLLADGEKFKTGRIVDVGTGSGCIALSLAAAWPEAEVYAADISDDALALAGENAARLGLAERLKVFKSDLLGEVSGPFDLVVANLPYIPSGEIAGLQREVQRDPLLALDGGEDGLVLIEKLITQASAKLNSGGTLAMEYHLSQTEKIVSLLEAAGFRDIRPVKDYQGNDRFVFCVR